MKFNGIILTIFILSIFGISLCAHHTKDEWKSRSIYQLLTDRFAKTDDTKEECSDLTNYCGGTFKGIQNNLDYIKNMGFDAIWISPPLKNKEGSFHGYHNIDINSINEHFGSSEELKDLINACHEKDIWVILDAVPNHMSGDLDISTFIPFNKAEHYHTLTDADCNGHWDEQYYKENCRIWGMPDLNQENEYVKETLINWLKTMLNDYGFDGIRYADVPNVPKWFWGNFTEAAEGTYTLGIVGVDTGTVKDAEYISDYQNYMDGVGDYPLYYTIREAFKSDGNMTLLKEYRDNIHSKYKTPKYNGVWLGNHDKPRFLNTTNDKKVFRNAIIYTLFYEGIPMFYYGDEQNFNGGNDPQNREVLFGKKDTNSDIYRMLKIANKVRKDNKIYDQDFKEVYTDEDFYAYTRGDVLVAVGNGASRDIVITNHTFKDGDKLCNQLDDDDCVSVVYPEIKISMDGEPKLYVKTSINNSKGKFISMSLLCLLAIFVIFVILIKI